MTRPNTVKKHPGGAPGAKILITTASLAITLGGWAAFTRANVETADTASPPPAALALELPRPSTDLKLAPQLMPTIVPAAPPPPQLAIARAPVIPAALLDIGTPAARPHAAAAPAPVAAPAPAAQPAAVQSPPAPLPIVNPPPLRAVSAPPQPVARTRSSK